MSQILGVTEEEAKKNEGESFQSCMALARAFSNGFQRAFPYSYRFGGVRRQQIAAHFSYDSVDLLLRTCTDAVIYLFVGLWQVVSLSFSHEAGHHVTINARPRPEFGSSAKTYLRSAQSIY